MNKHDMKVKSTLFHSLLAAAALWMFIPQGAQAQSGQTFTITNGTAKWLESENGTPYAIRYQASGEGRFSSDAVTSSQVTYDVNIGSSFVRLDTSALTVSTSTTFDQFCVWHNTDNPGYCYQEYTVADGSVTYRYYLRGTATDLTVWKVEKGHSIETATTWTSVEAGGYVDQSYVRNGEKHIDYRWFAFNGSNLVMSCGAAHRPEAIREISSDGTATSWFCPNSSGSGPAMTGAVLLPVSSVDVDASILHPTGANKALQDINLSTTTIGLNETLNPTPAYTASSLSGTAVEQYTQAYRTLTYATRLKGLNFSGYGTEDVYGSRGVPTWTSKYFYANENYTVAHDTPPAAEPVSMSTANINGWEWTLDNGSKRYLSISGANTANPTITCFAIPAPDDYEAYLTLTIYTNNGVSESLTRKIVVSAETGHVEITESENSVFVQGAVFGGGRMANVDGATDVLVINCDTISRVYGGNDISGTVANGSTVTIGNASSSDYIGINSVYGAGNGYYSYNGVSQGFTACNTSIAEGTDVRLWGDDSGEIIATAGVVTNVPLIYKTRVFINSPWARIDTVFGGARNADVLPQDPTVTYATSNTIADHDTLASVTVNAGTIFAVFGGNNVGGCLNGLFDEAANSYTRTAVNINMTNIQGITPAQAVAGTGTPSWNTDTAVVNSFYTNFGRHFGIRYVYGGGNKVPSALRSDVYVHGGMVDTAFAGGNEATVFRANIKVEVDESDIIYHNNWTKAHDAEWVSDPAGMANRWVGTRGSYNVRAVFGGNNRAAMQCVPDVRLVSGGVAVAYGGGNAGDMTNEELNIASGTHHYADWHVNAISAAKAEFSEAKNKMAAPEAALGTFIHVDGNSKHMWVDYIYGGCRAANVAHATMVHVEGGNIGAIFGGCNISGNIGQAVVTHTGGRARGGTYVALDDSARVFNNVYGGSNGYYHCVDDEHSAAAKYISDVQFEDNQGTPFDMYDEHIGLTRPTHNFTHVVMNGGTVMGNVYGGGNHATVGFLNNTYGYPTPSGIQEGEAASARVGGVHLSLVKGTIHGNVFGGSNMATVYGLSYFYIGDKPNPDGGHMVINGDVYGGNDRLGDVGNNVNVAFVDLAGNEIKASDNTALNVGGTAAYNTYILVEGTPQINRLFGGGNGAYNYNGEMSEYPDIQAYCESTTENATMAPVLASAFVDIHTSPTARINTLFGGGNAADVQDRVMVLVNTVDHDTNDVTIGTIFGGNNLASMACVPTVDLTKGVVGTVFGGGNMGHMLGSTNTISDPCGNSIPSVASYVYIHSDEATVTGSVFGGCNKADVHGMAYVLIENTSSYGIDTVYGGNDVSGRITGNTRVDIYGGLVGTVYGGSNGFYDYEMITPGDYRVREFAHAQNTGTVLYENSIGSPYVDETQVNILGGTVNHNIYGGGRMGDCRITNVYINDLVNDSDSASGCGTTPHPSTIMGFVYGGGEGDTARLDIAHRGNVYESTNVKLHHASTVIAQAYGGGKGGDVYNANITSYNTWDESFHKIFGGCWGADVSGTARLTLNANMDVLAANEDMYTALKVYGGNDFSGNCYRSELTINAGRYDTVYGAGCGFYPASAYTVGTSTATQTRNLYVPNNEEVVVTINGEDLDGTTVFFDGILFGGGQLGTTMRYKKVDGQYVDNTNAIITSAAQEKVADTNTTVATAHTDANDYAYIIVNVHGGEFAKDIFAGAQGQEGRGQLVYGLKILNMDKGHVVQSVYGGSQSVSDGYSRQECNSNGTNDGVIDVTTTMRPSSVLNLVGGAIDNHVYGAGYKGFAHGSVYVNVGRDAVENSTVWRTAYGPAGNRINAAYAAFKPGVTAGLSDALTFGEDLILGASVYAGANWGQNTGSYEFTGAGFYGGESRILIDGNGYEDGGTMLDIVNSVLGAGTSVLGGDLLSRIDIRNFGGEFKCHAEQDLMAIQRADALYLHNTGIQYFGITDASSALYSPNYAINKVDTVNAVGYNIIEIDAPKADISLLRFFEDVADQTCYDYTTYPQPGNCLVPASLEDVRGGTQVCTYGEDTACSKISRIDSVNHKYTALVMNNGVTVDVYTEDAGFGGIVGYGYLIAQDGTKPVVRARIKDNVNNATDGGFSETCNTDNSPIHGSMEYTNYTAGGYRFWAPGGGLSTREVVLLAHSKPSALDEDKTIKVTSSDGESVYNYSLAHTQIVLPPSKAGHYYKLGVSGIKISEDNDVMNLVDVAWRPLNWDAPQNDNWTTAETQGPSSSDWFTPAGNPASMIPETAIQRDANTTFGIVMECGDGFTNTVPTFESPSQISQGVTVITPNPAADVTGDWKDDPRKGFYSHTVASDGVSPVMDLYLTYDNSFTNSILGSVKFVLVEYNADGQPTHDSIVVEAYVSTIINEFKDMEFDLIATSNEGESNTFLRRGVLPATLSTRGLYIESVKWFPTKPSPYKSQVYESGDQLGFTLSGDRSDPGYILTDDPIANRYRFAVNVIPVENSSSGATSDIGWYTTKSAQDVYTLVKSDAATGNPVSNGVLASLLPVSKDNVNATDLRTLENPRGVELGVLDGRGLAGLNFELFYDGRFTTEWRGYYVGDIILGMNSYVQGCDECEPNPFTITLHVKVRPGTDTIFVGTVENLNRARLDNPSLTWDYVENPPSSDDKGRRPMYWVKTLKDVEAIWKEGTVVCVVDEVIVDEDMTEGGSKVFGSPSADEPMKIIRYTGHHSDKPNEMGVYRGPMINVTEGGRIAFRNVVFQGSAVGMLDNTYASHWPEGTPNLLTAKESTKHLKADTNIAFGPILAVTDGGYVSLENNVVFEENWNAYVGDEVKLRGGAISITDSRDPWSYFGDDRSTLRLHNNVIVQNNIVVNNRESLGHSDNGAVYLDKANLQWGSSSMGTAIKIINNRLDKVTSTGAKAGTTTPVTTYWSAVYNDASTPALQGWIVDTSLINPLPKGNVFLTRTAADWDYDGLPDYELEDTWEDHSSAVKFDDDLQPTVATEIGISRWFPGDPAKGEEPRDTIQIAYHDDTRTAVATTIYNNGNFSSDEGYDIIYSSRIDPSRIYEYRCATFRHQDYTSASTPQPLGVTEDTALVFHVDPTATCPNGKDTLFYRVCNGFYPYTYRWQNNSLVNSPTVRLRDTRTSNIVMTDSINNGHYGIVQRAVVDTLVLPYVSLPIDNEPSKFDYTVSATDELGCVVSKRIEITVQKDPSLPVSEKNAFEKLPNVANWENTDSYAEDETVIAKGSRTFRGVKINAFAWPHRSSDFIYAYDTEKLFATTPGDDISRINLDQTSFCEGDVINLRAEDSLSSNCGTSKDMVFSMWDFDPYYANPDGGTQSNYVVPNEDATVVAYYTPRNYWHQQAPGSEDTDGFVFTTDYFAPSSNELNSQSGGGTTHAIVTYNDDIHIYDEYGLAWFLNHANGLHGLPVRQFYFNKVYIHMKTDQYGEQIPYDMQCYRWTPVGTAQYPFRGWFFGVGPDVSAYADTVPLDDSKKVIIKNIIVDEPLISHVGFFGHIDTARIWNIEFQGAYIRGAHDAGVLAARSKNSRIDNVLVGTEVQDLPDPNDPPSTTVPSTTLIMTHNNSGGLIGYSEYDRVTNTLVSARFVGDAIYSGGVYGFAHESSAINSKAHNYNRMNGVYLGGIAGSLTGVAPQPNITSLFRSKRASSNARISNNYVQLITRGGSSRVGGIVGRVENAVIENNYVYGQVETSFVGGGVVAEADGRSTATHNYYAEDAAKMVAGNVDGRSTMRDNTDFNGSGNAVRLGERVYGVDNLTRVLNIWVREQNANGANYKTWTSDLAHQNNGYPFFGTPDLIPVANSASLEGCEEVEWMGTLYRTDTVVVERIIDSTQMVDSTMSTIIRVHHTAYTRYVDSAFVGQEYLGHGFYVSAAESELLRRTLDSAGYATLVLGDTLQSVYGCDSIVTLTLTFSATKGVTDISSTPEVKVYPNPTTSVVNVAAEGMTHVEVYDNEGRRLQNYSAEGQPVVTLNVERLAAGVYYLRVHTPNGVTIQKVIKR